MRIRGSHIAIVIVLAVAALVVVMVMRGRDTTVDTAEEGVRVPPPGEPQPKLEVETEEVNLGTIPNVGYSWGELKVYNRGDAPLLITDIQTSCACTLGRIKEDFNPIPPRGEGTIDIRLDPRRVVGFHSRKTLTVKSNDPYRPHTRVFVVCDVDPEYVLIPDELDMGEVAKGESRKASVIVRQLREEPLEVTGASQYVSEDMPQGDDFVTFTVHELPESEWLNPGKAEFRIDAVLTDLAPAGPIQARWSMDTNVDRAAQLILLKGTVMAPYEVRAGGPNTVLIMPGASGGPARGQVAIASDQPVRVTGAEFDESMFEVIVLEQPSPNEAPVEIRATPGTPGGQLSEYVYLTIEVAGKTYRERINVRGIAKPGNGPMG